MLRFKNEDLSDPLNIKSKNIDARGNVQIDQSSGTLTGTQALYNWETSTGTVKNASGLLPPWRFKSQELDLVSQKEFHLTETEFTSCELNPPHFHLWSRHSKLLVGNRISFRSPRLVLGELPAFWSPFFSKSLKPKKYKLRLEPGHTSRDGFTNKTIFGYPFSEHTYTNFRWDYLQRTGNGGGVEHQYFAPDIKGNFDSYYVRDTNPDLQPQSRRYSILWNHFQRLTQKLTMNSKVDVKSDQIFGNQFQGVGNQIRVENQTRGVLSEMGLNYQFSKASLQAQFDRQDKFDSSVSSKNFISKLTLPRLAFNTIPLTGRIFPFYTSFSASYVNETKTRSNALETLRYQRLGTAAIQTRKDLRLKSWTFTPTLGYEQSWQDRDLAVMNSEKDIYIGRYNVGGNVRKRILKNLDGNLNYRYAARLRKNQTRVDSKSDDYGIDTNLFTGYLESWLGGANRISLNSGYDLRQAPRNDIQKYTHVSERIVSPSLDLQWALRRWGTLYFRETYALFDPNTRKPVRTPLNTSGEIQWGSQAQLTNYSSGFSYSKTFTDQQADVIVTNKLKFFLTPKWYIDAFLSFRVTGPKKLDFRKAFPIEKTIRVVRDLHCWVFRMEFSRRPGFTEAAFNIDLKANFTADKNLFNDSSQSAFYPYRDKKEDVSTIFPANEQNEGTSGHTEK
jgi:hypothetical protein